MVVRPHEQMPALKPIPYNKVLGQSQNNRPSPWQFLKNGADRAFISRRGITVNESNAYVQ